MSTSAARRWSYLFNIEPDPLTGKRRQANGSGYRTEREAWKECRAAMAEYETGRVVSSSRRKVADALDEWLTRIEHSIKPSMVQNWRNYAAYYVIPYIGQRDVQDINGAVCDALYAKLLAEGRVKAKPKKRPRPKRFTCGGSRRTAGRCLAGHIATTPCGASARTPKTIRLIGRPIEAKRPDGVRLKTPPRRRNGSCLPAWSPRRS